MRRPAALFLALSLGACGYGDVADDSPGAVPTGAEARATGGAVADDVGGASAPGSATTASPRPPAPENSSSEARAARAVLGEWAAALEARDWPRAWALWRENGTRSGLTLAEYGQAFERFRTIRATIGPAEGVEGAAGSLYATFPVRLSGRLSSGEPFRLDGTMTLKRVNDVDGATEEQRQWGLEMNGLAVADARRSRTAGPG